MVLKKSPAFLMFFLAVFFLFGEGWEGSLFAQYIGGNADGHSLVANETYVAPCSLPSYFNVCKGGNADGYASVANETYVAPCSLPSSFNVAIGGNADGHAMIVNGTCYDVLPIELLYFTAVLTVEQQVLCQWATAAEINNDYFTVEKTKNGIDYEIVGELKGAGNSTMSLYYSILDKNPYSGTSYYRLKQTDYDGKSEYSRLVSVNLEGVEIIIIYPNPVVDEFTYIIGSIGKMSIQVKVIDIVGQMVINKTENVEKGITQERLDVSGLSSGTYLFQIITENKEMRGRQFQVK